MRPFFLICRMQKLKDRFEALEGNPERLKEALL